VSHNAVLVKSLLDEAFRVLQHDSDEDQPEYAHLRAALGKSFWKVLLGAKNEGAPCKWPICDCALTLSCKNTSNASDPVAWMVTNFITGSVSFHTEEEEARAFREKHFLIESLYT
jgi:hypothetical protein